MNVLPARLVPLLLATTLVACGGGGGGGNEPPVTPPPTQQPPPATISKAEAYRFLNQATFGATAAEAQSVIALGYEAWIDQQLQRPASLELPHVQQVFATYPPGADFTKLHQDRVDIWLRHALHAPDQLRQRVAFALSQIMVISQSSALVGYPWGCTSYYDMLTQNAFGNFRELMENVTLHPAKGVYLSMLGNQKPDVAHNIRPDENYARELMQLFTVGLVELNLDGSVKTDSAGQPIPTYDQDIVQGFAHVYTGWTYSGAPSFAAAIPTIANQIRPMQAYSEQHATGTKRMLSYAGAVSTIPAGQTPEQDLDAALDNIFNHPNVGPFIAKRLIQHLVTSNPSPQYVERIARKFNDDGAGKLKEPLLRLTQLWRAYDASSQSGKYNVQNITGLIGQGPLQAPSVFNFFSPFYAPPGEIANQGLVAPEMQVTTEYLSSLWTDYVFALAFCYTTMPVQGCPAVPPALQPDLVTIDASAERAMAANPQALVDTIADKLVGGPLSSTLSTEAKSMVERAPASETALRVAEALYLIASAPEVALQR